MKRDYKHVNHALRATLDDLTPFLLETLPPSGDPCVPECHKMGGHAMACRMPRAPFVVQAHDTFMSNWGWSDGRKNIVMIPCADWSEVKAVKTYLESRDEIPGDSIHVWDMSYQISSDGQKSWLSKWGYGRSWEGTAHSVPGGMSGTTVSLMMGWRQRALQESRAREA